MTATPEGNKKTAKTRLENDPDTFKKMAKKSQEAWEANGKRPRGFSSMSPEQRSAAARKRWEK